MVGKKLASSFALSLAVLAGTALVSEKAEAQPLNLPRLGGHLD